jgi:uncharacterized lipoprotein YajG
MKTRIILASAVMLLAFGNAKAQDTLNVVPPKTEPKINTIINQSSGDIRIMQGDQFAVAYDKTRQTLDYTVTDDHIVRVSGATDCHVTLEEVERLQTLSSGDISSGGKLTGKNLNLELNSSGDMRLELDYDTISIKVTGSGDVTLRGKCKVLYAEVSGSGDVYAQSLNCSETYVTTTGSGEVWTGKDNNGTFIYKKKERPVQSRSIFFDPEWQGFEAGLNMLFNTKIPTVYTMDGTPAGDMYLGIRPLRSWYFGFNIADVGIAFNRYKKNAGVFTGVGIGWNNFSWKNPVLVSDDPETGMITQTLLPQDGPAVKKSKLGLLYLQVPLMVEVRPIRRMYIDFGVTAGLRFAAWSKVKYADNSKYSTWMNGYGLNTFKLDATFRMGGDDMGFFINYALLPIYRNDVLENTRPLSFGFSLNF